MAESILDNKEQKLLRMEKTDGTLLSRRAYNAVIGVVLVIGLAVNAAMARYLPESAYMPMVQYPWAVLIGFIVVSLGAFYVINRSDNPVISFTGFIVLSVVFGYVVAAFVQVYTDVAVTRAFMLTTAIALIMVVIATIVPHVFEKLGLALAVSFVVALVAEIVTIFITGTDNIAFDYIFVIIFALYVGYDWQKSQAYPPTLDNAIDSAADIYVDIVNLFIRILSIIGRKN